jgi:hypothetical protein
VNELLQFAMVVVKTLAGDATAIVTVTALILIVATFALYISNVQ